MRLHCRVDSCFLPLVNRNDDIYYIIYFADRAFRRDFTMKFILGKPRDLAHCIIC